jgi:hypothetical protein
MYVPAAAVLVREQMETQFAPTPARRLEPKTLGKPRPRPAQRCADGRAAGRLVPAGGRRALT